MVPEQICRCLVFDKCWAKCCCGSVKRSRNMEGNRGFFFWVFFSPWTEALTADTQQAQSRQTHNSTNSPTENQTQEEAVLLLLVLPFNLLLIHHVILQDSCFTSQPLFPPAKPSCLHSKLFSVWMTLQPRVSSFITAKLPLSA